MHRLTSIDHSTRFIATIAVAVAVACAFVPLPEDRGGQDHGSENEDHENSGDKQDTDQGGGEADHSH